MRIKQKNKGKGSQKNPSEQWKEKEKMIEHEWRNSRAGNVFDRIMRPADQWAKGPMGTKDQATGLGELLSIIYFVIHCSHVVQLICSNLFVIRPFYCDLDASQQSPGRKDILLVGGLPSKIHTYDSFLHPHPMNLEKQLPEMRPIATWGCGGVGGWRR